MLIAFDASKLETINSVNDDNNKMCNSCFQHLKYQLETSDWVNPEHLKNIKSILTTFEVSQLDIFNWVKNLHVININSIVCTFSVWKFSNVIFSAEESAKKPLSEIGFSFNLTTISSSVLFND